MKKFLYLLLLMSSPIFSMQLDTVNQNLDKICFAASLERDRVSYADNKNKMYIEPFSVHVPNRLGELDLYHSKEGFYVRKDDKKYTIKKYFTDPIIRNISKTELKSFLTAGYLSINRMNDGEFSLKAKGRIHGSGALGASIGAFIGKAVVYVVGHGAIQIAAIATGPAYPVTVLALEGWF
ncbi:MAG TPA: hypothetical protein VII94_00565, partial [Candidatus Saccharimonadales bacterium]